MSTDNQTVELTYEERIQACDALVQDLKRAGVACERWITPKKGANDAGVGVALYDGEGAQQANVTVDGKSNIRVRNVLDTLPGTEQAKKFAKALGIAAAAFIPDGKFTKAVDAFGTFRKYTKRASVED